MKIKITDLMDLYEDPKCPLASMDADRQPTAPGKETVEVKQSKHRFGWKEALALAAVLAVVVLGGFGVKKLLNRNPTPQGTTGPAPITSQNPITTQTPIDSSRTTETTGTEPAAPYTREELNAMVNPLLTAFAQQSIQDSDVNLAGEYELAQFAHLYTKINHHEAISYRSEGDENFETLSLEEVNEVLTRLLGKTVSPAEGTDYTVLRGDNYASHESFRDGRFWWPAADGDPHNAFAIGWVMDDNPFAGSGRIVLSVSFTVYEPADYDVDTTGLLTLTPEEAEALVAPDGLHCVADGIAYVEYLDGELRMLQYQLIEPAADPETDAAVRALFADPAGWYCRALTSPYGNALDVDLGQLFYLGIPGADNSLSDAEKTALREAMGDDAAMLSLDCERIPADAVQETLSRLFGTDLYLTSAAQNSPNGLFSALGDGYWFLSDRDCFYHFHGDTNLRPVEIETVSRTPDGLIRVGYRFVGDAETEHQAVLLREVDGSYQILANLEAEEADDLLRSTDLAARAAIQSLLSSDHWFNFALGCSYDEPADVNVYAFFYDGISGQEITEAEMKALYGDEDNYSGPPTDRLPRAEIDRILLRYFGLTLEQTNKNGINNFRYLPETDCYYNCHGDTHYERYRVLQARQREDGAILFTHLNIDNYRLFGDYETAVGTAAVRLYPDGSFHILANQPGEWSID